MNPDSMKELLRQADRAAGPPPTPPSDLAARIERIALRRQGGRIGAVAVAAALLLAVGTSWLLQTTPRGGPAGQAGSLPDRRRGATELAAVDREIARLRAEADARLAVVRRMIALRDQRARLNEFAQSRTRWAPANAVLISSELEKTACNIVDHADRLYRELDLVEPAAECYRRAIRLFPESRWAEVARQRLAEIKPLSGETL